MLSLHDNMKESDMKHSYFCTCNECKNPVEELPEIAHGEAYIGKDVFRGIAEGLYTAKSVAYMDGTWNIQVSSEYSTHVGNIPVNEWNALPTENPKVYVPSEVHKVRFVFKTDSGKELRYVGYAIDLAGVIRTHYLIPFCSATTEIAGSNMDQLLSSVNAHDAASRNDVEYTSVKIIEGIDW